VSFSYPFPPPFDLLLVDVGYSQPTSTTVKVLYGTMTKNFRPTIIK
jgi:hypothetical protein